MATGSTAYACYNDLNSLHSSVPSGERCPTYAELDTYKTYILTDKTKANTTISAVTGYWSYTQGTITNGYAWIFNQTQTALSMSGSTKYRSITIPAGSSVSITFRVVCQVFSTVSSSSTSSYVYQATLASLVGTLEAVLYGSSSASPDVTVSMNLPYRTSTSSTYSATTATLSWTNTGSSSVTKYLQVRSTNSTSQPPFYNIKQYSSDNNYKTSGTLYAAYTVTTSGTVVNKVTDNTLVLYNNCKLGTSKLGLGVCHGVRSGTTTYNIFANYPANTSVSVEANILLPNDLSQTGVTQTYTLYGPSTTGGTWGGSCCAVTYTTSTIPLNYSQVPKLSFEYCLPEPNFSFSSSVTGATISYGLSVSVNSQSTSSYTKASESLTKTYNSNVGAYLWTRGQSSNDYITGTMNLPYPTASTMNYICTFTLTANVTTSVSGSSSTSLASIGEFDEL